MKSTVLCGAIAALLCGTAAVPADESKKPSQQSQSATEQTKERLINIGTWHGTIGAMAKDRASFTLEVPIRHSRVRVTVWVPADTKIRLYHEPEFDAKGRPLRGTPRPDPGDPDRRLGGKRGTVSDLRPDQAVRVRLERNRTGQLIATTIIVLNELPRY
jgi:hypothetical protein